MNQYIKRYLKQSSFFFPVMGKEERLFLTQLARSIQDYFGETEPDSLDAVICAFGPPNSVVENYLANSDIQPITKRIRIRNAIRFVVVTFITVCLMAALATAIHFGWQLYALHEIDGYDPPIYAADGTLLEE